MTVMIGTKNEYSYSYTCRLVCIDCIGVDIIGVHHAHN